MTVVASLSIGRNAQEPLYCSEHHTIGIAPQVTRHQQSIRVRRLWPWVCSEDSQGVFHPGAYLSQNQVEHREPGGAGQAWGLSGVCRVVVQVWRWSNACWHGSVPRYVEMRQSDMSSLRSTVRGDNGEYQQDSVVTASVRMKIFLLQ